MQRLRRLTQAFAPDERRRLGGFALGVLALHVLGWGLVLLYAPSHPVLTGLATLAYSFGLRHAFDVDHIAAIDSATRQLLASGRRPLGVGFFFSLGHSTVVLGLTALVAFAVTTVGAASSAFAAAGGTIGASVSALFLLAIGLLNLLVLVDVVRMSRAVRRGAAREADLDDMLRRRGALGRLLGRFTERIGASWHLYPLGFLFGLGFDTATEVGLLTVAGTGASGGMPIPALLALPILFASGMVLMDTADGVFMSKAYAWAFTRPARKLFYNVTVTLLSVLVALTIGLVEAGQVASERLGLSAGFWAWLETINFETLGYLTVGVFVGGFAAAALVWRFTGARETAAVR